MRKLILVMAAAIISGSAVYGAGPGTTGAQFLKIEPAARPVGMGGAYSALSGSADSIFYNPAAIAGLDRKEFSGTYLSYFQGIHYGSLAGVLPNGDGSTFGLGINYIGVSDIPRRATDDVNDPDGTSSPDGTFGAQDTALNLVYALKNPFPAVLDGLDLGVNLRTVYLTIDDESAFSAMLDMGGFYPVNDKLSVALTLQNIGMGVKFKSETDPLPFNIKTGVAWRPVEELTLAIDLNQYLVDRILYASAGAEYWLMDMIALRAGYKYGYDSDTLGAMTGLSGGMGLKIGNFGLDYALAPFGDLGNTHRVSFGAKF